MSGIQRIEEKFHLAPAASICIDRGEGGTEIAALMCVGGGDTKSQKQGVCMCLQTAGLSVGPVSLKSLIRLMSVINPSDLVLLFLPLFPSSLLLFSPRSPAPLFGRSDFIKAGLMRFPVSGGSSARLFLGRGGCVCLSLLARYLPVKLLCVVMRHVARSHSRTNSQFRTGELVWCLHVFFLFVCFCI